MAKYDEGDEVRLKKKISFNTTHVRPNTLGVIKKIKGGWGSKEYHIRWKGVNFDIIHKGDKDFHEVTQGEGW